MLLLIIEESPLGGYLLGPVSHLSPIDPLPPFGGLVPLDLSEVEVGGGGSFGTVWIGVASSGPCHVGMVSINTHEWIIITTQTTQSVARVHIVANIKSRPCSTIHVVEFHVHHSVVDVDVAIAQQTVCHLNSKAVVAVVRGAVVGHF